MSGASDPSHIAARHLMAAGLTGSNLASVIAEIEADQGFAVERGPDRELPPDWRERRLAVFERDGWRCTYCRADVREAAHCDHVVPRSRGRGSEMANLTTACAACNIAKSDRTPAEWRASS